MPQISIPLTTYRISAGKPNQKWGSPAALPLRDDFHRVLIKVPIDKIPQDATITSALLQFYSDRATTSKNVRVRGITSAWNSSATWNKQPTVGSVLDTDSTGAIAAEVALPTLDITAWAVTRSRNGLRLESTSSTDYWVRGSSGRDSEPVLIVTYVIVPDTPGNLRPDGDNAAVSVAQPTLTYAGDEDMTQQRIQWSSSGSAADIDFDTMWLDAVEGELASTGATGFPTLSDGGAGIYWRAITNGPDGQSAPSEWAYYKYVSLPDVTIVNPPSTTDDGSPTLTWTVEDDRQTGFKAEFWRGDKLLDTTGWRNYTTTRDWTPDAGVKVPGGTGQFILWVRDDISPRSAAQGAPTMVRVVQDFTTTLTGAATAVNTIALDFAEDDAIPIITGTRSLGTPDEVTLYRDDVRVPLYNADGDVYTGWAPAVDFFTGTAFRLPDYTYPPRTAPEYSVRVRTSGNVSAKGPTLSEMLYTPSVWLVNPRTGRAIEIQGLGDRPVVNQETFENSILHMPINGGKVAEPKRRRIIRSTRFGSIEGAVLNNDASALESWAEGDSSLKYRLIFGIVNWPVIIGDYSPSDLFYDDVCTDERVAVTLNFWQRLSDN